MKKILLIALLISGLNASAQTAVINYNKVIKEDGSAITNCLTKIEVYIEDSKIFVSSSCMEDTVYQIEESFKYTIGIAYKTKYKIFYFNTTSGSLQITERNTFHSITLLE
jgi:hypothetical protein